MQRWYNPTHTYMDGAGGNDGKDGIDGAGYSVKVATRVRSLLQPTAGVIHK